MNRIQEHEERLSELTRQIYANARAKGWYHCPACTGTGGIKNDCSLCDASGQYRNDAEALKLIDTEFLELESASKKRFSEKLPSVSEHEEEAADIAIRALDLAGHWSQEAIVIETALAIDHIGRAPAGWPVPRLTSYATEALRSDRKQLASIFVGYVLFSALRSFDNYTRALEVIELKHNYNTTRPHKHGRKF